VPGLFESRRTAFLIKLRGWPEPITTCSSERKGRRKHCSSSASWHSAGTVVSVTVTPTGRWLRTDAVGTPPSARPHGVLPNTRYVL
jgi:hypothetical protein